MDLGLLQREVAERIGTQVENLSNWERGRNVPTIRFVPGIIRFLGYDPFPTGDAAEDRVRVIRRRLGLSQRKFADLLGVDPSTVWKWERRGRAPSRKLALRLDGLLGHAQSTQ